MQCGRLLQGLHLANARARDLVTTLPDEPPALGYIERTLADSYRKEIDQ
jgi:hypothetical protein